MDYEFNKYGSRKEFMQVLVEKAEGKRPLGKPGCRWENNNKMALKEIGCGGMDWIDVAQDANQ
jgi:hypothetical protein